MATTEEILDIVRHEESPVIEFKRQWYWSDTTDAMQKNTQWGEFIKDVIGLSNGYIDYAGKDRYLIIGFCEKEKKFFDIGVSGIKELSSARDFKRNIVSRLENFSNPAITNIEINLLKVEGLDILCIKMPSPTHVTQLSKELRTKTRALDIGQVLVRKGQLSDEVRTASFDEITLLRRDFDIFAAQPRNIEAIIAVDKYRSISSTVQQYIDKNSSNFVEIGYPVIEKDWNEGVIFELFKICEPFGSAKFFLYIHEKSSQGKTYGHLRKKSLIKDGDSLIILTERPVQIKDAEKRIENLKNTFKTTNVFFIDQFGRQHLYGECMLDYEKYNLPVYVQSLTENQIKNKTFALDVLTEWYESESNPLIVIKGYGGIGKTTLVKQFLDNVHTKYSDVGILFIESNDIIEELDRLTKTNSKIDDIYDFYRAQVKSAQAKAGYIDGKIFTKDLLRLSVDNGSLIIVLDGMDEVIARLGSRFDVNAFIKSISTNYSSNLEKSKILITCRDYFWDALNKKEDIVQVSLRPFTEGLAEDFFRQHFGENEVKILKAMEMANKFAVHAQDQDSGQSATYIPYVLDMIAYLIKHRAEFGGVCRKILEIVIF